MKRFFFLPQLFLFLCAGLWPGLRPAQAAATKPMAGRYIIDDSVGRFKALTFTGGALRRFAHNHVLLVRRYNGEVRFDPKLSSPSSLQIAIKTDSLESIDDLDAKSRQIINGKIRGEVLKAAKYPEIHFKTTSATTKASGIDGHYTAELDGELTLHGVTRPHHITADISTNGHWLHATGVLKVKQTEFGIEPERLLGSLIAVKDEVHLVFEIDAFQPVRLTGVVKSYHIDYAGFESRVSIDDPDYGAPLLVYHPRIAQRLMAACPAGSVATLWIRESRPNDHSVSAVVGWGANGGESSFLPPYLPPKDIDWFKSHPPLTSTAQYQTLRGRLERIQMDEQGEIIALLLRGKNPADGETEVMVFVPAELRQSAPSARGVQLEVGDEIKATGLPVAPRAGAISAYAGYLYTSALIVNGKATSSISPIP